jgi:RNA-directed DNA polymerase
MTASPRAEIVYTKQQRIAELAQEDRERALNTLNHYIDLEWMLEAYNRTRKNGAVGIDGQAAADYAENLTENLTDLLNRAKSGSYRAPPVKRVYIPKGDGKSQRPIGIPTFEDKILQRAVTMVLESIYEQDFHAGSYGFRPGRSAHQALSEVSQTLRNQGGGWVIELDIRSYFDRINHAQLRTMIQKRMKDGVLLRLLGKWLKAGIMEEGVWIKSEGGTPQGGVVSPILANIYLHYVLDEWFEQEVRPRIKGRGALIRFADDATLIFSSEQDARKVLEVLPKRFARFGLELHPEKTKLVKFKPHGKGGNRETFDLLGFTHYWGRTRKGSWSIKRKTISSRLKRGLKGVKEWCRKNRHLPIREQHVTLSRKLRGHNAYYGIRGNSTALSRFRYQVSRIWIGWLGRRSQRARLTWERANLILKAYPLPAARIVHQWV